MASIVKSKDGNSAMSDEELPGDDEAPEPRGESKPEKKEPLDYSRKEKDTGSGYFTIYKKGQGYWTRMGTVIGGVVIGAFTTYNLYAYVPTFLPDRIPQTAHGKIGLGVAAAFALAFVVISWRLLNKPSNVDFLIATDSEMKKVNWTSRRELIGSTKIVIIFMFLIALFLFGVDQTFGWLMYWAHVLKVSPVGT